MAVLAGFLMLLGMAGAAVALVMLIVKLAFKRGWTKKRIWTVGAISLVLFVVGMVMGISTEPDGYEAWQEGYEAGRQAALNKTSESDNTTTKTDEEKESISNESQANSTSANKPAFSESPSEQLAQINLERKVAQNAKELAKIIEEVIKESGYVKECYVIGAEEEVSTGGYWLSAEVYLNDAKNAWQVVRNGVLAAYLNKGSVQLVKVSVNIIAPPEDNMYALQVSAGKNHFDDETLKFLKNGTWIDFETWMKENETRAGYKQYPDELWAQGPLAL